MTDLDREVGERIRAIRTTLTMTQRDLAERAHMSVSTLVRAERGGRGLTLPQAVAVAQALGVSLQYLVTGRDAP